MKNLINRTELDIYIPSKNIAIEYNGLYWHSEQIRSNTQYHYDKWLACKEKNITLIQVWEDVWRDNPQIIKQLLSELLVPSQKIKIEGIFTMVSEAEARDFLTKNHVNGFLEGTSYYAMKDTNLNMIAMLVLNEDTSNKNIEIVRYAGSQNNIDSFGQLIEQIRNGWGEEWQLRGASDNMLYEDYLFLANDFIEVEVAEPRRVPIHLNSRILNETSLLDYKNHVWDAGHTIWKNK